MNMVIYPLSLLRLAMGAASRVLDLIANEGTLSAVLDQMQHRYGLYDLLDYSSYAQYDSSVYNFVDPA